MIVIAKDILTGPPEIEAAQFVPANNGYEALQMPDGRYVSWTGAEFHTDATNIGPWELCKRSGQVVVWRGASRCARAWDEE